MTLQPLNQLVGQLQQQENWRSQQQFKRLAEIWPDIVGEAVARQTCPTGLKQQVLWVATSTAAWSQTLMFERHRILRKLNQQLTLNLTDIRFSPVQWRLAKRSPAIAAPSELLQQHPSFINVDSDIEALLETKALETYTTAFERWAYLRRQQTQHYPLCPECQCPTPPGELKRWATCALCAAKRW
ncbi:DUF721 domain-containing protein [Almyronema epifaneia]|uniref:DUF721 domain-containing protein n=1 Tax=Almyronema epifaneia S1 TaxID=2991925 RepID=A0ABW6III9_9CYAN